MKRAASLNVNLLDVCSVTVKGPPHTIDSLRAAREHCEAAIPGISLDQDGGASSVDCAFSAVATDDAGVPAPPVWRELLVDLLARPIGRLGLFFVDAGAVQIGDAGVLLEGLPGEGKGSAAYYLGRQGCPVLSTGLSLIDEHMRLVAGSKELHILSAEIMRFFPELTALARTWPPHEYVPIAARHVPNLRSADDNACRIPLTRVVRLNLAARAARVEPVTEEKKRMVSACHILSRHACRSALTAGFFELFVSGEGGDETVRRRHPAIRRFGALEHFNAHGRPQDLRDLLDGGRHGVRA